jgi:rare lipoprotein A
VALAIAALCLEAGCVSRPRYRTDPPPNRPARGEEEPAGKKANRSGAASKPKKPIPTRGAYQVGMASYYAHEFHGKPTANGEIFDMNGLTAAHRELPLGTYIRVIHLGNGRKVVVKVNDRGPFIEDRILDLSLGAARHLDMIEEGVAEVKIEIVKKAE